MVTNTNLLPVAQIVKSYNTTGEVIIKITSDLLEEFNRKEPVFIIFDELPVPFYIDQIQKRGNSGALVKLDAINDISHAEELIRKTLYISSSSIDSELLEESPEAMEEFIIGCTVENEDGITIGEVIEYHNFPNNPCIEIELSTENSVKDSDNEQDTVLVPFNEDLILGFNPQERLLQMEIPKGLLEI